MGGAVKYMLWLNPVSGILKNMTSRFLGDDKADTLDGMDGYPPILGAVETYEPQKDDVFVCALGDNGWRKHYAEIIWGTGIMYDGLKGLWFEKFWDANHRRLDIRAVRGPMTREVFLKLGHQCPEVYGDPGILMPLIYQPKDVEKTHDYMVIPQYTTENEVRKYFPDDLVISMNSNDYKSVINRIVSCKKVYSSSLHGIILAEAYGVPAVFFRGVPAIVDFKYKDYYASTGRYDVPMAGSLAEAFSFEAPELLDLTNLQQGLLDAFPYDLWED